jgi:hypothetical protein
MISLYDVTPFISLNFIGKVRQDGVLTNVSPTHCFIITSTEI